SSSRRWRSGRRTATRRPRSWPTTSAASWRTAPSGPGGPPCGSGRPSGPGGTARPSRPRPWAPSSGRRGEGAPLARRARRRARAEAAAREALKEAARLGQEERWTEALGAVRHAEEFLAGVKVDTTLRRQAGELGRDLEMARRLEEARLQTTAVNRDGDFDH